MNTENDDAFPGTSSVFLGHSYHPDAVMKQEFCFFRISGGFQHFHRVLEFYLTTKVITIFQVLFRSITHPRYHKKKLYVTGCVTVRDLYFCGFCVGFCYFCYSFQSIWRTSKLKWRTEHHCCRDNY